MNIKWLENIDLNTILMNKNLINQLGYLEDQQISVSYGTFTTGKKIMVNDELSDNCIGLSIHFTDDVDFPIEVEVDAIITEENLQIGPLIGMVMCKDHQKINQNRLELLKERIPDRDIYKGIIFVCSQDWMDVPNKLMKGYYFTKNGTWEKGIFPIPTVIYNRTYIKKPVYKKLSQKNVKVFNNCRISKLKLWKLLYKEPLVNSHLPFTQSLTVESFKAMTEHFNSVYLKPINLSRGRGIIQVSKKKLGYDLKYSNNREEFLFTNQELEQFISKLTENQKYLVQKGVPYFYKKSLVDFRVYMQKDETKEWSCSGIYGRISKPEHIITNLKHSQEIFSAEYTLNNFFQLNKIQTLENKKKMIKICENVCIALEKKGQIIADVAIDVVVDKQLKVWVLEVQVSYASDERLYQLPKEIYKKVWQTPIHYAKALTGFTN